MIAHRLAPVLRELQPLRDRFAAAGHRLFLVGGTVRDLVLGAPADAGFDIDATTTARPAEIKRCLQGWADAIWTQGERFGTIGATKRNEAGFDRIYEITTHRAESYDDRSRKPDVQFSDDITADLSRRDFTVNAMAVELTAGSIDEPVLIDPYGGLHDLQAAVLRTPVGAEASFSDDPLRMLRAARFIARYGLQPDASVVRAVRSMGERMQIVSAERVRDELGKLLAATEPGEGLTFLAGTGLLRHVVPELAAATSQRDERCHEHLWAHTVAVVDAIEPGDDRGVARLAALLRPLGAERARRRLQQLRASNDETDSVTRLLELAAPVLERLANGDPWSDADVRRHLHAVGDRRPALEAILRAEAAVHAAPLGTRISDGLAGLAAHIADLAGREPLDDLGPQIDGAEVMAILGVPPGRAVGEALAHLAAVRLDRGLLDPPALRHNLVQWWSDHKGR